MAKQSLWPSYLPYATVLDVGHLLVFKSLGCTKRYTCIYIVLRVAQSTSLQMYHRLTMDGERTWERGMGIFLEGEARGEGVGFVPRTSGMGETRGVGFGGAKPPKLESSPSPKK
jgi:hypothetical protein